MKLAAVAGPLGALKDARNKLQADLSRIGPKLATLWPEIRLKRRNQAGWAIPAKPWHPSFRSSGLRRMRKPGFLSTVFVHRSGCVAVRRSTAGPWSVLPHESPDRCTFLAAYGSALLDRRSPWNK